MKVWVETGGDTGGGEVYAPNGVKVGRIDWDTFNDGGYSADDLFGMLETFGGVMPDQTRIELLQLLQPDDAEREARGWPL